MSLTFPLKDSLFSVTRLCSVILGPSFWVPWAQKAQTKGTPERLPHFCSLTSKTTQVASLRFSLLSQPFLCRLGSLSFPILEFI